MLSGTSGTETFNYWAALMLELKPVCRQAGPDPPRNRCKILAAIRRDDARICDGVGHTHDLDHFGDVMHTHDVRAAENAGRDGRRGAPRALIFRRAAERFANEALSRRSDE